MDNCNYRQPEYMHMNGHMSRYMPNSGMQNSNSMQNNMHCPSCMPQQECHKEKRCGTDCVKSIACCPIAMAYVPTQKFGETFDLCKALKVGTIFPELFKPFCGKGGACNA